MANILPFKGIFYNPALFADYEEVLAPPYDEISSEQLSALFARSPYNIVRVECARDSGWQSSVFTVEDAALRACRTDRFVRDQMLSEWHKRLAPPGIG